VMVHDGLNDRWFSLTPDWAEDMKQNAHPDYRRGLLEWDGLILDGWLPSGCGAGSFLDHTAGATDKE
jgi:hypothetical protein